MYAIAAASRSSVRIKMIFGFPAPLGWLVLSFGLAEGASDAPVGVAMVAFPAWQPTMDNPIETSTPKESNDRDKLLIFTFPRQGQARESIECKDKQLHERRGKALT
jgi:hypothetical protein